MRPAAALAGALLVLAHPLRGAELRFHGDPEDPAFGSVAVAGLPSPVLEGLRASAASPEAWREVLAVYTAEGGAAPPAVLGDWSLEDATLRFTPRFPFVAGMRYRAVFDGARCVELAGGGAPLDRGELLFVMPEPPPRPPPRVSAVYPSEVDVPENLLRLYLHFSEPMRGPGAQRHVRVVDEAGAAVALPFVEVEEGLWDPQRRRLTLFFHPGRLKRGLAPRERLGPALRAGRRYRLVVDAALRDASGRSLGDDFSHPLRVGPADRSSPDPEAWRVVPPGSPDSAVALLLDEPLDRALLRRLVGVEDSEGRPVAGIAEVSDGERRWALRPSRPWRPGRHAVVIRPGLEDRAGNRPDGLFDEDPGAAATRPPPRTLHLPFEVAAAEGGSGS